MDFGKVLTRAWQIIWNNKVLWIFGILVSCGQGGGGGGGQGFNYSVDSGQTGQLPPQLQQFVNQIERFFEGIPEEQIILWVVGLIFLFLLIGLIFWVLSVYGRVGLIRGTLLAEAGKSFGFRTLASDSWARLGGALGLNFVLGAAAFLVAIALVLFGVVFGAFTLGIGLICLIPLICLLIPVFIGYGVYIEMANVALVGDELGISAALSRAWQVFRNNLGNLAVMALILILGGFIAAIIIGLPVILVAAPAVLGLIAGGEEAFGRGLLISAICLVVALPLLILLNGIIQGYIKTAWALTYMQLRGAKPKRVKAKA